MTRKWGLFNAIGVPVIAALIGAGSTLLSTDNPISRMIFPPPPPPPPPPLAPIQGEVMLSDVQPGNRKPLQGVQIVDTDNPELTLEPVVTDVNGYFLLKLKPGVKSGQSVFLQLTGKGYQIATTHTTAGDDVLYTYYLWPSVANLPENASLSPGMSAYSARFVKVAYAPPDNRSETFQIPNRGSVRCQADPCSPDHKWKANIVTSPPLDAGAGNVFLSGHAQCIAGPCAWTHIENPNGTPSTGQRFMTVKVRNWSDTATYRLSGLAGRP